MKILAFDTSCMMGSVALVDGSTVLAEQTLNIQVTHSERLIPSIETVLNTAGVEIKDLDGFGIAIGPGSFTGLRIGLAAAKGMAFVTKKPIVGVSSLTALAYNLIGSDMPVVSLLDARRGEFYIGVNRFKDGELVSVLEDTVMPPDKIIDYIESIVIARGASDAAIQRISFVGDGVLKLGDRLKECLGDKAVIPPPAQIHPRASNIAWIAARRIESGDSDDLAALGPNYIRKSDAERV